MSTDLAALDALPERFARAWNRGDVEGLFEIFAADADFIDTEGMLWHGRDRIAERHRCLFRGALAGSMLRFRTAKVRRLSRSGAVVYGIWSMTGQTGPLPVRTGLLLFVLSRDGAGWSVVAAQSTDIPPE